MHPCAGLLLHCLREPRPFRRDHFLPSKVQRPIAAATGARRIKRLPLLRGRSLLLAMCSPSPLSFSVCQFAFFLALVFATLDIVKGTNDTFEKRAISERRQLKHNARADTDPADTNLYTSPRETLAFNDGFNLISSIPNVHFSLMHMSQRTPYQMDETSWAPGLHPDSGVQPFSIFFNACLNTAAGKRFQAAQSGRLDRGYSAWLIMFYGNFNTKYGSFDAWDWKQDGNMVVSCQYARVLRGKADGTQKQIPITDFEVVLESSRQMIANMKSTYKLGVDYVGMPARNRKQLEAIKLHQQPGRKP